MAGQPGGGHRHHRRGHLPGTRRRLLPGAAPPLHRRARARRTGPIRPRSPGSRGRSRCPRCRRRRSPGSGCDLVAVVGDHHAPAKILADDAPVLEVVYRRRSQPSEYQRLDSHLSGQLADGLEPRVDLRLSAQDLRPLGFESPPARPPARRRRPPRGPAGRPRWRTRRGIPGRSPPTPVRRIGRRPRSGRPGRGRVLPAGSATRIAELARPRTRRRPRAPRPGPPRSPRGGPHSVAIASMPLRWARNSASRAAPVPGGPITRSGSVRGVIHPVRIRSSRPTVFSGIRLVKRTVFGCWTGISAARSAPAIPRPASTSSTSSPFATAVEGPSRHWFSKVPPVPTVITVRVSKLRGSSSATPDSTRSKRFDTTAKTQVTPTIRASTRRRMARAVIARRLPWPARQSRSAELGRRSSHADSLPISCQYRGVSPPRVTLAECGGPGRWERRPLRPRDWMRGLGLAGRLHRRNGR